MKTTSKSVSEKIFNFAFLFLASLGLGYSLVNQFILDQPNKKFLLITICLFFVAIDTWQGKKTMT